jgi:hypothetical protein
MSLDQIPVYIKVNSIYPTGQVFAGLAKKWDPDFDGKRNIVINTFPGFAGDTATFTYVDFVDGNKHKDMMVTVAGDHKISISAPALTVPCTVAVRLWDAPISVTVNGSALDDPNYNSAGKKLTIPVETNKAIDIKIEATPQRVINRSIAIRPLGRILVKQTGKGIALVIPPLSGIRTMGKAKVTVFDLTGKTIMRKEALLNPGIPASVAITPCIGASIARVEMNGEVIGKVKILSQ